MILRRDLPCSSSKETFRDAVLISTKHPRHKLITATSKGVSAVLPVSAYISRNINTPWRPCSRSAVFLVQLLACRARRQSTCSITSYCPSRQSSHNLTTLAPPRPSVCCPSSWPIRTSSSKRAIRLCSVSLVSSGSFTWLRPAWLSWAANTWDLATAGPSWMTSRT